MQNLTKVKISKISHKINPISSQFDIHRQGLQLKWKSIKLNLSEFSFYSCEKQSQTKLKGREVKRIKERVKILLFDKSGWNRNQ